MRATSIFDGLTIVTLVTVGLISTGNAEHGLFHGNALRQIMHKPMPSSGGSSDVTILVPTASQSAVIFLAVTSVDRPSSSPRDLSKYSSYGSRDALSGF